MDKLLALEIINSQAYTYNICAVELRTGSR